MKKYLVLIGLLIILSGCALGAYDGRGHFHGVAIAAPYPYYAPCHPYGVYDGNYYRQGNRYYSHGPDHYYWAPGYLGYYR